MRSLELQYFDFVTAFSQIKLFLDEFLGPPRTRQKALLEDTWSILSFSGYLGAIAQNYLNTVKPSGLGLGLELSTFYNNFISFDCL